MPISIKTHSRDPVPFAMMGKGIEPDDVQKFDEEAAKRGGYGLVEATQLVGMMTKGQSQQEPLGHSSKQCISN